MTCSLMSAFPQHWRHFDGLGDLVAINSAAHEGPEPNERGSVTLQRSPVP